jgi:hypothetical protein
MPSILDAGAVTVGTLDGGVEHASWSEDGFEGPHLLILRNPSDRDGYCVVVNGRPNYGGVLAAEVAPGETRLTFSADAAHELGLEREVTLRYDLTLVDDEQLRATLTRLLSPTP